MKIIGIGGLLGHDSNASLIIDGIIIASSQEERFTRLKHDASFPINAVNDCLSTAGLSANDIDIVVFAEKPFENYFFQTYKIPFYSLAKLFKNIFSRFKNNFYFEKEVEKIFPNAKIKYAWHHFSHAIAAYYSSNFDNAAFLCVDGKGEYANASIGYIDKDEAIISHELPYANGLGLLYTIISHFLGFPSFGSEYKIMGLAPYGKPLYIENIKRLYKEADGGAIQLEKNIGFHPTEIKKNLQWVAETINIPIRLDKDEILQIHIDLAASIQYVFEELVLKMANFAKQQFKTNNLLFCGGCAQNCVAAGKLRDQKIFKNIFNSPVGGDMGSSLGAVLAFLHNDKKIVRDKINFRGYYLGSSAGLINNHDARKFKLDITTDVLTFMANELAKGKIIAWVNEGMELGARALGARSILANPMIPNIQSEMNLKIKFRESFRPFAPAIMEEYVKDWFEIDQSSDFMQFIAYLKPELRFETPSEFSDFRENLNYPRCIIPSVVHVDYSARLQTISKYVHPRFHMLIQNFHAITGIPILINTSFNVNGQPIVRTAEEAWECFINTDIDLLVIDEKIYQNPFKKTKQEKLKWLEQFEEFSK
ncbi:carbamoyltransferase [Pedobacter psychrotolerans]|uniref:carbamoyltransferase family protein n=1 Tax=Pedobacter psychrotolerans TaxID=1843235 RepID=UPI003F95CE13